MALLHQENIVGDGLDVADNVGRQQDDPVPAQIPNIIAQTDSLLGVQSRCGLVQDQDLRLPQHGLSQQGPLLHAAGEGADFHVALIR